MYYPTMALIIVFYRKSLNHVKAQQFLHSSPTYVSQVEEYKDTTLVKTSLMITINKVNFNVGHVQYLFSNQVPMMLIMILCYFHLHENQPIHSY